jgi:hypothetical protein
MCGALGEASMLSMPAAAPHRHEPMVLVVYVNFAVGNALAQRLMESCLVTLVSAESALARREWQGGHDVVVLCPYLTTEERDRLLAACAAQDPSPAVLELSDEPEAVNPHVRPALVPAVHRARAEHVFSSLTPTR